MNQRGNKGGAWAQPLYAQNVNQLEALGTLRATIDGRVFAYARAGGVALSPGKLTQTSVVDTNAKDEASAEVTALGSTTINVTFGGAVTADYYKDGYLHISDGTGEGAAPYRIKSHPAGTTLVAVELYDPLRIATVATTSLITLTKHPQDAVVVFPTTQTGAPAGVPPISVTEDYYFWNQVKGPASVWTYGTIVIGNDVGPTTAAAGAVAALASSDILGAVGRVLQVNATTYYSLIQLAIPGY